MRQGWPICLRQPTKATNTLPFCWSHLCDGAKGVPRDLSERSNLLQLAADGRSESYLDLARGYEKGRRSESARESCLLLRPLAAISALPRLKGAKALAAKLDDKTVKRLNAKVTLFAEQNGL